MANRKNQGKPTIIFSLMILQKLTLQVFLRNSVFDPLEEKRKALLTEKMIVIQRVWRGYVKRKGKIDIYKNYYYNFLISFSGTSLCINHDTKAP